LRKNENEAIIIFIILSQYLRKIQEKIQALFLGIDLATLLG